ncbi:MAG: hypothetical protein KBT20_09535 [Bacteroidales bacterium]|nr:hypothetical protein [Candidatus Liminaster caballi]
MVYKFVILSDEVDDFRREIEIDAEATFLELNNIIMKTCKYKTDQMSAFYLCNSDWERTESITMDVMDDDPNHNALLMDKTHLSDLISQEEAENRAKLIFIFDTMCDRGLFMQVREVIEHKHLLAPAVVTEKGKAPKQEGDLDDMFKDFNDEMALYGDEDYDPDEIDLEGYQNLEDIESAGY